MKWFNISHCTLICWLSIGGGWPAPAGAQESSNAALTHAKDLTAAGKWGDALPILNGLIKQNPQDTEALSLRAAAQWAVSKDWHAALLDYSAAIRLAPKNAALYNARGWLRFQAGDSRAALRDLNTAVSLDPKSVAYLANRAHVRYELRDMSNAFLDYSRLIEMSPNDARLYLSRGMTWDTEDRKALDDYSKAIELKPGFALAFVRRGFTHLWWGQQAEAQADFDTALKLDPTMKGEIDYETEFVKEHRAKK